MPSNLSTSTLTSVTSSAATFVGLAEAITASGGKLTSFSPYALVYTALGGDSKYHVYSVNLSNAGVAPVPQQVSNLAYSGSNSFDSSCFHLGYTNVLDPTTAFLIVEVPTAALCSVGTGNSWVLMHLTDSSSTTPTSLPSSVQTETITELFNSDGSMAGLVLIDSSKNLTFFPASGFPNFTGGTSVSGPFTTPYHTAIHTMRDGTILSGGSVAFITVTQGSAQQIYRVTTGGTITQAYSTTGILSPGGIGAYDNTNVYFTDSVGGALKFEEYPIAGGSATTLYTDSSPGSNSYSIVDSDGSVLVVKLHNLTSSVLELFTLSTSAPSTPTVLYTASPTTAFDINAFLDWGSDHLFVDEVSLTAMPTSAVFTPTNTTALGVGGSGISFAVLTGTIFHGSTQSGSATVLEYTGLPAGSGQGGASLFTMNPKTFATTQVTQGGTNYVVPANTSLYFGPVGTNIGGGFAVNTSTSAISGLIIDATKSQMLTITQTGDNVSLY